MSQAASRKSSNVPAIMNSMSSGCAAMARARGRFVLATCDFANTHRPSLVCGPVRCRHHSMCHERIAETRQRHLFAALQRIKECLELRLIGMIADIAAIEQLHREVAPGVAIQSCQLLRMELVVENAAFAPDKMRVEVVGLQTIDHRRALPNASILELQDR